VVEGFAAGPKSNSQSGTVNYLEAFDIEHTTSPLRQPFDENTGVKRFIRRPYSPQGFVNYISELM
jgi:hypothetical protein